MSDGIYRGRRKPDGGTSVTVGGAQLNPRFDLFYISPGGFDWGMPCDGANQLAVALLASAVNDEAAAKYHKSFASVIVSKLDRQLGWKMTGDEIRRWYSTLVKPQMGLFEGEVDGAVSK